MHIHGFCHSDTCSLSSVSEACGRPAVGATCVVDAVACSGWVRLGLLEGDLLLWWPCPAATGEHAAAPGPAMRADSAELRMPEHPVLPPIAVTVGTHPA